MAHRNNCINTGITAVPQVTWGMHICHFFKSKEDLSGVIVPFIKAGLADNEKCVWVTSDPLRSNEALIELNRTGTGVDDYIDRGQLLIVDQNAWYTQRGKLDIDAVLQRWIEAGRIALDEGYTGLRAVGVMPWILREDWDNFIHYESVIDSVIRKHQMVALCSYSLDNLRTDEVIEVVSNHTMVIIQRTGGLMAIGNSRLAKVCAMKGSGLSYATIGNKLGVTQQRAHQMINKRKTQKKVSQKVLTTSGAASLLNIHINTIRRWSDKGLLPHYRIGQRGDRRFKREDIDNLVRTGVSYNTQRNNAEYEI